MDYFHLLVAGLALRFNDTELYLNDEKSSFSKLREILDEQPISGFEVVVNDFELFSSFLEIFQPKFIKISPQDRDQKTGICQRLGKILRKSSITRLEVQGCIHTKYIPEQLQMLKCKSWNGSLKSLPHLHSLWTENFTYPDQLDHISYIRVNNWTPFSSSSLLSLKVWSLIDKDVDLECFPNLIYAHINTNGKLKRTTLLESLDTKNIPDFPVLNLGIFNLAFDPRQVFKKIEGLRKLTGHLFGDVYGGDDTLVNICSLK